MYCRRVISRSASAVVKNKALVRAVHSSQEPYLPPVPFKFGKHRSDAEILISKVPVIEVAGNVAVCDGGSGALGHPIEYIQLNTVSHEPNVCKYCGLRYKRKAGSHHH